MKVESDTEAVPPPAPPGRGVGATRDRLEIVAACFVVAAVTAGVVLRFVTVSDLWLDEALTVNIADRFSLSEILSLSDSPLRRDGAPPLFYALQQVWMQVFGTGDVAARSLSGVIGVATLPLAWWAGRRLGGPTDAGRRWTGWASLLVFAASPYAIGYATETRMYGLQILLVLLGYLALARALERPSTGRIVCVALVTAGLLYNQYWSLYLVAVVGAGLAWGATHGTHRRAAGWCLVGVGVGVVAFVPWVPTLLYQLEHTGTPWATVVAPPTGAAEAFVDFAGGDISAAWVLVLPLVLLALLAVFGRALGARRIELDLGTVPGARLVAATAAATMLVGLIAAWVGNSAVDSRYLAVVFPLFALLVAYGTLAFGSRPVRYGVLAAVVVLGLIGGVRNAAENRTQAEESAVQIRAGAQAGDVVGYCPDQVGPDVSRLVPDSLGAQQGSWPAFDDPGLVDWVDYAERNESADPATFADELLTRAGPEGAVWLVFSGGYRTYGTACEQVINALAEARSGAEELVIKDDTIFESMGLWRFPAP